MRVRVVADLVSLGKGSSKDPDMCVGVLADDEERRQHAARLQRVEDHRRPRCVGAVVEGERYPMRVCLLRSVSLNDEWRWKRGEGLVDDESRALVDSDGALARGGPCANAQDLAVTLDLGIVARRDFAQGVRIVIATVLERAPERWVFAA